MQISSENQRCVIGFFASDAAHLLLDQDACIVTATLAPLEKLLREQTHLDSLGQPLDMRIRKIRFGAIMQGLDGGGAYAFDQDAYAVFYPLANQYGYALEAQRTEDSSEDGSMGLTLFVVRK